MAKFSKVNEGFVPGPDDTENDGHKGEDLVHEAEQVQLEVETHDLEKDVAGYGDADVHGCWHRFVSQMRMAFGILDRNAFYVTQTMQDALMNSQVDGEELSLAKATSIDDFWKVLKGPVFENIYLNKWYNDDLQSEEQVYYIAHDALLLGLPRLRQVRMSSNSCTIPQDFQSQISKCYSPYAVGTEDRSAFGPSNSTAWTYTSADILSAGYHWGKVAVYNGGGYYVDLPRNETEARELLDELFEGLWVDRGTRAIFLHLTAYNPNVNLFCIYKLRCQYFKGFWNIIDIMVILLASLCAGFNICRTYSVNKNLADLLASPDVYPNFERLSYWEMQFTYAVGVLVFLVYIKIFKYVSFNKTMNQLNLTLGKCAKDIAGFGVMFFIVFFAFAQLGYLAFGTQVTDFATFAVSLLTLFRIILGDFDFQALHDANSVLGPLYFLVYIFFVFFVLINMFIAIINDTYLDVKSNLLSQPSEVQMKSFFKKMEIIQDMVNYQEAQLGQSFEQVAKFFADKTASKEEVNQAFSRLIRLENCLRTVTERIRAMAEKLESVEEAKSKRPDRLAALLENMVANVSAVEKKALETEDEMMPGTGTVEEDAAGHLTDGVRNRSQGGISQLLRSILQVASR
nr:unnamed protein product [Spirometra erinaceieuropaei]